jgi:PTS system cellobiose-specific IIB component
MERMNMADKTIMLVCAAGMSTSLLAVSASEADAHLAKKKIDVLMLGPQVKYMKKQFEDKVAGTDTKMDVINMQDYGMMNGEKVLKTALTLMGE